jgi:hypothetical protein
MFLVSAIINGNGVFAVVTVLPPGVFMTHDACRDVRPRNRCCPRGARTSDDLQLLPAAMISAVTLVRT